MQNDIPSRRDRVHSRRVLLGAGAAAGAGLVAAPEADGAGARDGDALRPPFGFEVLSSIRLVPQADGSIQRLSLENCARTQKPAPKSAR